MTDLSVLQVHTHACKDARLTRLDRVVIAQIVRRGRVGSLQGLADECHINQRCLKARLETLSKAGYIAADAQHSSHRDKPYDRNLAA